MSKVRSNTTQRSWTDYDGSKPIQSWKKDGFYNGQPLPLPLAPDRLTEEKEESGWIITPRRKKKSSALQNAMDEFGME